MNHWISGHHIQDWRTSAASLHTGISRTKLVEVIDIIPHWDIHVQNWCKTSAQSQRFRYGARAGCRKTKEIGLGQEHYITAREGTQ